jgi:hypothetical protein
MSQLTFATVPGFVDIPDSALAADQPVTDFALTKISNNAKFAAVRPEIFHGYYKEGELVILPVSPVDGYQYVREELSYAWSVYSIGVALGPTNGATSPPAVTGNQISGGGIDAMSHCEFFVEQKNDPNPGRVHARVFMTDGSTETPTSAGVLMVTTIATRLSG